MAKVVLHDNVLNPGLNLTSSKSFSTKFGLKTSLEASIGQGGFGTLQMTDCSTELESSVSTTDEKSWQRETKVKLVARAGKNYRVLQNTVKFESPLVADNCKLLCSYTIEKSS